MSSTSSFQSLLSRVLMKSMNAVPDAERVEGFNPF